MSESSLEALARAWVRITEEIEFPIDYEGTASLDAHRAIEAIQEQIQEHIVATGDRRLFSLLQLLGQASLRMEQELWPRDYERMRREIEAALHEADNPNVAWRSHEEVMRSVQERIDKAGNKSC
jgi:hypothetical protein